MKKENLGKICFLKALKLKQKADMGFPNDEDLMPFYIIELVRGGYLVMGKDKNIFEVKSKDIYIK